MTIVHSNHETKLNEQDLLFIFKLNQLTDEQLEHHFPKLNHLKRDEKIKFIVTGK